MMSKSVALGLALILSATTGFAQDLESLLDEGGKVEKSKKAQASAAQDTALVSAIKKTTGKLNSEQQIFLRFVEAGEWDKATLQFLQAFEGTSYQRSPNGRAVFGYAQFQAGLPVTGVETLFLASNPKEIHPEIRGFWTKALPETHFAWKLAKISWAPAWEDLFGHQVGLQLKLRDLSLSPSIPKLKELSEDAVINSTEKGLIEWQLALAYSLNDQPDQAAKTLAALMKSPKNPIGNDLIQITAARLLFQNGYFDAAIKYYEKVSKKSEFWTDAQEEMAWSHVRKGDPQNAIAISKSLTIPAMAHQVGPEAFFVQALSQLKICDYLGVTQSLGEFPKRFKARTASLTELSKGGETKQGAKVIALMKTKKIDIKDLGKDAESLPRLVARDQKLYDFVQAEKNFENEARVAEVLYSKSLALTGLQGFFESLKKSTLNRAHSAQASAAMRLKELASLEVEETKEILRKLHIVEAEVIQQVAMADRVIKDTASNKIPTKRGTTGSKGPETVSFKADEEVWFDEISNYKVDVKKACHARKSL